MLQLPRSAARMATTSFALLAAALALSAACGRSAPTPQATYVPKLENTPCTVPTPAGQAGRIACATFVVPQDRSKPGGLDVRLAVAVLRHTGATAAEPFLYLTGGPGGAALQADMQHFTADLAGPLQLAHDIVFFDQRGTGLSTPSLDCPEETARRHHVLESTPSAFARRVGPVYDTPLFVCRDRLVSDGVDLRTYSSTVSAQDAAELMAAMGYGSYDVYGVSYGARLALTMMRDVPQHIQRVVLDSPEPLQVNSGVEAARNFQSALDAEEAACAASAVCKAEYGDLKALWQSAVSRLVVGEGITAEVRDPASGANVSVSVDAARFIYDSVLYSYKTSNARRFPQVLKAFIEGHNEALQPMAQTAVFSFDSIAVGVEASVTCNEEIPFYTQEAADAANAGVQPEIVAAIGMSGGVLEDTKAFCFGWDKPDPPAREQAAVTSAIPTLVLSGAFDPVTPPAWAELTASTLSQSSLVKFPATGHGVVAGRPDCAIRVITSFFAPTPIDTSCVGEIDAAFAPPATP